jgi:hypothetical protein
VRFDRRALSAGARLSFRVRSKATRASAAPGALTVQDVQIGPPQAGPIAQTMTATLTNSGAKTVKAPIDVVVVCFGEAREPAFAATTTLKRPNLRPGNSTPVTVNLSELCPSYLVGAEGTPSG